jgi:ribonucleoside-diphosphate reductase beta chain
MYSFVYIIPMSSANKNTSDIFSERKNLKPHEYPELYEYKDAIQNSYWKHDEFNFNGDVQDFHTKSTPAEKSIIKKTMLSIAQIEVQVKTFWSDIYTNIPKPEIANVGMTFAESEVRHMDAYSHLLDLLGIQDEFKHITEEVPAISNRIDYLDKCLEGSDSDDEQEYTMSVLLFSMFVEHVSLFSQFLIMTSFDKYENKFLGISNAVEATSKEEQIHGLFGVELVNQIQEENPDLFDENNFEDEVKTACQQAYDAEMDILDWIFSEGELDFLPREYVDEFLKYRFNKTLRKIDVDEQFDTDEDIIQEIKWFDEDIMMTKDNDFFSKRSTTYNKKSQSVTSDDIF